MVYRALFLIVIIVFLFIPGVAQPKPDGGLASGGNFTLTDHQGRQFQLSGQRGKVVLLFFGYTSCTEACPIILTRVNSVFKLLGTDGDKALAVFVSVDPQRDTPEVLREYVRYFSAHAIALTGKKEELEAVVKLYGASYEIEKSDSALGYHVNHTTDIYLIDARGALRSRCKHTDSATLIADRVKDLLR